ncbi:hypothetical protein AgCh_010049 [Apium graveolens]
MINAPGPCVLFATPGMISGGFSLEVFEHWAPYEDNLIVLSGIWMLSVSGDSQLRRFVPFLDALETQYKGTTAIKKNKMAVLVQEYEHFEAKTDESLTGIYDRFLTLLSDLSLVEKVYDLEDSNTKFLRALSEEWETHTSIIRH